MIKDGAIEELLGLVYVVAWSISMYPPVWINYKQKSTKAVSVDFVMLNTAGYIYLQVYTILQLYCWQTEDLVPRPKVTQFDLWYSLHGSFLNFVLLSQIVFSRRLWKFYKSSTYRRMKTGYFRILMISLITFAALSVHFIYSNLYFGWDNTRTLAYCNNLFLLKISMSLIKYIPQVKHNYDRKSVKGFAIEGVLLDCIGGIASMLQLLLQLSRDGGFSIINFLTNFGKIGLALVTLVFNFIFISQWLIYK